MFYIYFEYIVIYYYITLPVFKYLLGNVYLNLNFTRYIRFQLKIVNCYKLASTRYVIKNYYIIFVYNIMFISFIDFVILNMLCSVVYNTYYKFSVYRLKSSSYKKNTH